MSRVGAGLLSGKVTTALGFKSGMLTWAGGSLDVASRSILVEAPASLTYSFPLSLRDPVLAHSLAPHFYFGKHFSGFCMCIFLTHSITAGASLRHGLEPSLAFRPGVC